jgi:hypothetical protein
MAEFLQLIKILMCKKQNQDSLFSCQFHYQKKTYEKLIGKPEKASASLKG